MVLDQKNSTKKGKNKKIINTKQKISVHTKAIKDVSSNPYQDEIILVVTLVISILFIISNFNLGGKFGNFINQFIFGMFGFLAYFFPYLLFIGIAFFLSNRENKKTLRKIFSALGIFLVFISFIALITNSYSKKILLLEFYKSSARTKSGGGLLGGLISSVLNYFFGKIGAIVILIAIFSILIMFLTEKFFFTYMKENSSKVLELLKQKKVSSTQQREVVETSNFDRKKRIKKDLEEFKQKEKEFVHLIPNEVEMAEFIPQPTNAVDPFFTQEIKAVEDIWEDRKIPRNIERESIRRDKTKQAYELPPFELLIPSKDGIKNISDIELKETAIKLQRTLESFGVFVTITNISCGPTVTRYELQPEQGVKVSKITRLADDIKLNLAASDIRIEAPIPGKAAIGIEVPNKMNTTVLLRELLESKEFQKYPSYIAFAVGKDIGGQTIVADIAKMPHLLIAGATGSGKSVCINTLIMSILYKANPEEVKLIMIDPKVVELNIYNGIPHLLIPVVTEPKKASAALHWAVIEMTDRYKKFAQLGVRDIKGYNKKITAMPAIENKVPEKMSQVVIIVDELADLMMVAPGEVEEAICRLAQLARAAGIHLILATQRPSVNVITGLIKANIPSRIAFSVSSSIDSRTILDSGGAEKLLGRGDMLFFPSGVAKPIRIQGAFVSDNEVNAVVKFLIEQNKESQYNSEISDKIASVEIEKSTNNSAITKEKLDSYFEEAGKLIIQKEKASIGILQRTYKIGFNRAARIMDQLYEAGVVGKEEGTKPRKILMSIENFEQYINKNS